MGFLNSHQRTAVTSIINDCCDQAEPSQDDYYIESQLSSLLDAIKNQRDFTEPGAVEAARALRKQMKYGNNVEQYNALKILDSLVVNGATAKFMQPLFNDDKLLDRLQYYLIGGKNLNDNSFSSRVPNESGPNQQLSDLTYSMMTQWYNEFNDINSLNNMFLLYERCSKKRRQQKKKANKSRSNKNFSEVPDFMNDEADMSTPFSSYQDDDANRPRTNAELDKKFKIPKINYEKEAPKILQLIAEANIMSTNLLNTVNSLQKDELSIHSIKANDAFDQCRAIRRKVLRYLQLVQREELLGPLLKCNDDLVLSLKRYEEKSVPVGTKIDNDDSDSDTDSLANYESDDASVLPRQNVRTNDYDEEDSDYDDYHNDRVVRNEEPPTTVDYQVPKKAPPPVPPKSSIFKSSKFQKGSSSTSRNSKNNNNDYDPFSDVNEVAPVSWS